MQSPLNWNHAVASIQFEKAYREHLIRLRNCNLVYRILQIAEEKEMEKGNQLFKLENGRVILRISTVDRNRIFE